MPYVPIGKLFPKDGSEPFYSDSKEAGAEAEYDSDDEYLTPDEDLADFSPQNREQRLIPASLPDRRFVWTTLKHKTVDTHLQIREFTMKGADTILSLSPSDEDYILIRSDILRKSHPYFESGLSSRWPNTKLDTPMIIDGHLILHRYELEFHADCKTSLVRKSEPTQARERATAMMAAFEGLSERLETHVDYQDMFDEYSMKMTTFLRKDWDVLCDAFYQDNYEFIWKTVHYLGFEMLCGFLPKFYSRAENNRYEQRLCHLEYGLRSSPIAKMIILFKLMEWIHAYASFRLLSSPLERMILGPKFGESLVAKHPYTFLRIAKHAQAEQLFKVALSHAVREFDSPAHNTDSLIENDAYVEPNLEKKLEHEDDGGRVYSTQVIEPRNRYVELEEQLDQDEELAYHIVRMHGRVAEHYNTLHARVAAANVKNQNKSQQVRLQAQIMWRFWFSLLSTKPTIDKAQNLRKIVRDKLTPQEILSRYLQKNTKFDAVGVVATEFGAQLLDHLLDLLKWAKDFLQGTSVAFEDADMGLREDGAFNLSEQFATYRYPWQPFQAPHAATMLTEMFELPNHDADMGF